MTTKSVSRFLSLVLRHRPELLGIELDDAGWIAVDSLLAALRAHGKPLNRDELTDVVRNNDKQRFQLSEDGRRIRATQGHSVDVDLGYSPVEPSMAPEILLHGTPLKSLPAIRQAGLKKMSRHHVHLHQDASIARAVGDRRGASVILKVRARELCQSGSEFFVTPNNVWLTDCVPPQFIEFPADS